MFAKRFQAYTISACALISILGCLSAWIARESKPPEAEALQNKETTSGDPLKELGHQGQPKSQDDLARVTAKNLHPETSALANIRVEKGRNIYRSIHRKYRRQETKEISCNPTEDTSLKDKTEEVENLIDHFSKK